MTAWNYGAGLAYELHRRRRAALADPGSGRRVLERSPGGPTNFVLRFGAGVKVTFGRVGMRLEGVDYFLPDLFLNGKGEHDVHITGGLLVRF